ncbi:hypothetical protein [Bradyrhizobium sp. WSM1417]|uniref:hypothetical protein n=1 Tax=Bradyrhizobium sp. WSM1417 TaxID=754500 RepID=UPI000487166D|nr:hypothetical protein [Bradyrhizobium sp. WSM1417]
MNLKQLLAATIGVALLLGALKAPEVYAFGMGREGASFGRMGAIVKKQSGGAGANTGSILLVDGSSFLLQVDGTSRVCLAGGC